MTLARVAGRAQLEQSSTLPIVALRDNHNMRAVAGLSTKAMHPIEQLAHDVARQRCANRTSMRDGCKGTGLFRTGDGDAACGPASSHAV